MLYPAELRRPIIPSSYYNNTERSKQGTSVGTLIPSNKTEPFKFSQPQPLTAPFARIPPPKPVKNSRNGKWSAAYRETRNGINQKKAEKNQSASIIPAAQNKIKSLRGIAAAELYS